MSNHPHTKNYRKVIMKPSSCLKMGDEQQCRFLQELLRDGPPGFIEAFAEAVQDMNDKMGGMDVKAIPAEIPVIEKEEDDTFLSLKITTADEIRKEDVNVSLENGMLIITVAPKPTTESSSAAAAAAAAADGVKEGGKKFLIKHTFDPPTNRCKKVQAKLTNGVLKVVVELDRSYYQLEDVHQVDVEVD